MEESRKNEISEALNSYLQARGLSQSEFSKKHGFNIAYINQVTKKTWNLTYPKDETFNKIAAIVTNNDTNKYFDTQNAQTITGACHIAQKEHRLYAITGQVGSGKTYILERYAEGAGVFYFKVNPSFNKREFLQHLLHAVGIRDNEKRNDFQTVSAIVNKLTQKENQLLIIDEAEYMKFQHWNAIKGLLDELKKGAKLRAGVVIAGAEIKQRIEAKAKSARKNDGFAQLKSRLARAWVTLEAVGPESKSWKKDCKAFADGFAAEPDAVQWLLVNCSDYRELYDALSEAHSIATANGEKIDLQLLKSAF